MKEMKQSLIEKLTFGELRIVGISLAVLSLGLAIAWGGLFLLIRNENPIPTEQKTATSSGILR